jgi:hypothetical protein
VRRLRYAGLLLVPAVFHCNAILGVEDVRPASTTKDAGAKPKPSGDDDDDDTTTTTPKPTPKPDTGTGGCNGAVACKRIAFVTRAAFTGKLGGIAGADLKCDEAAKAVTALAGHSFRAWLSDTTAAATSRLPHGTSGYVRTDQGAIVTSFDDLVDGSITAPIALDEKGLALPAGSIEQSVWTGTTADGLVDPDDFHCANWTADTITATGLFGDSQAMDAAWTEASTSSCNAERHLYCVEF